METQKTDSTAVAQALEDYYFKGIYEGNPGNLGNIFHPGTLLFGDVKGQPYAKTLDQYLNGVATAKVPKIRVNHLREILFLLKWFNLSA